jgi:hypothetical protein
MIKPFITTILIIEVPDVVSESTTTSDSIAIEWLAHEFKKPSMKKIENFI